MGETTRICDSSLVLGFDRVCVFQVVDESVPRARVLSEDWAALLDAMLLVPFLVP